MPSKIMAQKRHTTITHSNVGLRFSGSVAEVAVSVSSAVGVVALCTRYSMVGEAIEGNSVGAISDSV
jgi:hypothetical protein